MILQEALKGMKIKNWEMRIDDKGFMVMYARFTEKEPVMSVDVKEG